MKKIMIALAAAATAMFSFGDGDVTLPTGTSFEALAEGSKTVGDIVDKDDAGATVGDYYWYSTAPSADELGVITNDVASGVSRPDLFANQNQANTKSLQIDTTAPLVRTALPNSGASSVTGVAIGNDGIYLDTLVKFTAAEDPFTEMAPGDKIAIEYVEREAEYTNGVDQVTGEPTNLVAVAAMTNFVVRAGLIGENLGQTNYYAYVSGDPDFTNFDKDAWHRLTVRTIADVGDGNVGFVIYLDGDMTKTLEYSKDVDAGFGTLNALAQTFYNSEKHALFPSAIAAGATGGSTISSVAFSGNGFIDDVSFAAEAPNFIKAGEAVVVPFVADAGVTAISVSVAGVTDPISVVNGAATLPAQTTAFTVTVTVDEANGYTFGSMTVGDAVYNTNPASVTGYAGGDITITTIRNNFNLFDENGDPIQGTFQTLSEALAKEGVATIKLAYDYDVDENESASFVTYAINNDVTLDLNGKTITAVDTEEEALFTVGAGAELVVIDSVGGGAIDYDTEYGVFDGDGETVVGATSGDFGPTIIGPLLDTDADPAVEVVRAKLDGEGNSDTEDSFAFEDYIAKGSDVSDDLVNGYWVVAPQGGSEPKEIAVPTAASNLVYDGTEQTGVAAATGYTLTGVTAATNAGKYTATATPASGYAWVGGSTDPTNIVWYIGMKGVTPTIVLNPASATLDANKTTVGAYTSVAAYDGEDLLTVDLDYYVSGLDTEVTTAGVYTVGVIQKAWSEGQNYMITNSQFATLTITAGGGSNWPASWNSGTEPASMAEAFDAWVAKNDPTAENAEAAFLVGVNVADYTSDFAAASINIANGKVVITGNYDLTKINGALAVKMGDAPNALNTTTAVAKEALVEGAISLTPALGETKKFYQLVIGYPAN